MGQPDKRRKILNAAVEVFARHGFYNSKVSHIARAAGVADGTIYLYFKNKEDLLIQVFVDTMDTILEHQREVLVGADDPVEQLERFVAEHMRLVSATPALAEVITVELRQSSKFMRSTDMKPFGHYLAVIARIVRDGQERGVFARSYNPRRVARALFGVLDELALEWAMGHSGDSIEDICREVTDLFLSGLRVSNA
jgi:TetR/AcrR family transcriptional regulator, fatty acid metabolism regulator protein